MKQVGKLNPFGRFCCTIGNLPTSYMESLTYEQQLLWFCKFLDTEVIPAVNANAEAIIELQNYLKNLDLQDYVDNKLDEMAESGQLTDIIAQYLQLAGLLCFNTKADLKAAQNLVDGSFAKTFGTTTYNDGYGYFYKIRTLINTDVIDDDNLLALTDYPTLVAEKMPDAVINNIISRLNNVEEKLNNGQILFLGDSYGVGVGSTDDNTGWIDYLANLMNLNSNDYYKIAYGGSGFIGQSASLPILTVLQNNISQISDTLSVKKIIIGLGANDIDYSKSDIQTAIVNFMDYVDLTFPNAKTFLFVTGFSSITTGANTNYIINMQKIYEAYKKIIEYGVPLNSNCCDCLRLDNNMNIPINHPNNAGYLNIAKAMFNILNNGDYNNNNNVEDMYNSSSFNPITKYDNQAITNIQNGFIKVTYVKDVGVIEIINSDDYQNWIQMQFNNLTMSSLDIPIGTIPMKNLHPAILRINIPVVCQIGISNQPPESDAGRLEITADGTIHLFTGRPHGVTNAEVVAINIYQSCPVTLPIGLL